MFIDKEMFSSVYHGNASVLEDMATIRHMQGEIDVRFHQENSSVLFLVDVLPCLWLNP